MNDLAPCIPLIFSSNIDPSQQLDLVKFAAISLDYLHFILNHHSDIPVESVEVLLSCADAILKERNIVKLLDTKENLSLFCSCVNSLFYLVQVLLKSDKPLPSVPNYCSNKKAEEISLEDENTDSEANREIKAATQAVHQLYILVCWFYNLKCLNRTKIPQFLFSPIETITISLSRLSITNSYLLIPWKAWKIGWVPETVLGVFKTQFPALPMEILQDVDVLEEYIFR